MKKGQQKRILFNEEMQKDFVYIQNQFKVKFGIMPSNTKIMNLLLQTFKEANTKIQRKPKSKKCFSIQF